MQMDNKGFFDALKGAVDYAKVAADFMKDFFECIPEPIQGLLFALFVLLFGFGLVKIVISIIK